MSPLQDQPWDKHWPKGATALAECPLPRILLLPEPQVADQPWAAPRPSATLISPPAISPSFLICGLFP